MCHSSRVLWQIYDTCMTSCRHDAAQKRHACQILMYHEKKDKADVEHAFGRGVGGCREDTRIDASAEIDGQEGQEYWLRKQNVVHKIKSLSKDDPRRISVEIPNKRPRGRIDEKRPWGTSWFIELELSSPKTIPLSTQTFDNTPNPLSISIVSTVVRLCNHF
jgi:hypothetical protein